MLRLLANIGADCELRKCLDQAVCQMLRDIAQKRAAGTALNPVWDSQCGIDAMWRDRCDACSYAAESMVSSRGAGDGSAARRFS